MPDELKWFVVKIRTKAWVESFQPVQAIDLPTALDRARQALGDDLIQADEFGIDELDELFEPQFDGWEQDK